jgi:hypothetical protein
MSSSRFSICFPDKKKYLIFLSLALAFIFFPFIEENVQIGNSKTLFHTGNLKSPNGVLNRNNGNCLLGPGIDTGKILSLKKRTTAKLLMMTIAFCSTCFLFVILPLSLCTLSSAGPVKLRDIHKYLLSQGCLLRLEKFLLHRGRKRLM